MPLPKHNTRHTNITVWEEGYTGRQAEEKACSHSVCSSGVCGAMGKGQV